MRTGDSCKNTLMQEHEQRRHGGAPLNLNSRHGWHGTRSMDLEDVRMRARRPDRRADASMRPAVIFHLVTHQFPSSYPNSNRETTRRVEAPRPRVRRRRGTQPRRREQPSSRL